jgi:hypothetical protein
LNEADLQAALLRVVVDRAPAAVPDATTVLAWESFAAGERVLPLLYELLEREPTDVTDDQREEIQLRQEAVQSRCVTLEHHAIESSSELARRGVRTAILKGIATAHLDYPDPSWRDFADVDLLVDPEDRARATTVLERGNWVQRYALPQGHERFTHAITFVRDGIELDLHQRIGHRSLGLLVPTTELLDRTVAFEVGGHTVRALADVDRLIHSAIHAVTSRRPTRRLSSTADVLLLTQRCASRAAEVLERSERWRMRPLLERAATEAFRAAQLPIDARWLEAMGRPTRRRDRLVEWAYLADRRRPLVEELAYLRLLPNWSARRRYVSGYFEVGADYAEQHGRASIGSQIRYAFAKLRSKA